MNSPIFNSAVARPNYCLNNHKQLHKLLVHDVFFKCWLLGCSALRTIILLVCNQQTIAMIRLWVILFPTCRKRVVRFYVSCPPRHPQDDRPASPPQPPHPAPPAAPPAAPPPPAPRNTERETINTKITIYTVKCLNGSDDIPKHGLICESLFAGSHFMCTFFF
jgi:hypothetical protein